MVQVVEYLPTEREDLSSSPSTTKIQTDRWIDRKECEMNGR